MRKQIYKCDMCGSEHQGNPLIELKGKFKSHTGGILMPRDIWDFCSVLCLLKFLQPLTEQ